MDEVIAHTETSVSKNVLLSLHPLYVNIVANVGQTGYGKIDTLLVHYSVT
jgi:hypothetical protein